MDNRQFERVIGIILAGGIVSQEDRKQFANIIDEMTALLDEADADDVFGTEGWRRHVYGD